MIKSFKNGKDTMPVIAINEHKRHGASIANGVHVFASRAETTMITKRYKFIVAAFFAGVYCTIAGSVTAVKLFSYIFDDRVTRM